METLFTSSHRPLDQPTIPNYSRGDVLHQFTLEAGEPSEISTAPNAQMASADDVNESIGIAAPQCAELTVGDTKLAILNLAACEEVNGERVVAVNGKQMRVEADYLVVQPDLLQGQHVEDENGILGVALLSKGEAIDIGTELGNFRFGEGVRPTHFSLEGGDGKIKIEANGRVDVEQLLSQQQQAQSTELVSVSLLTEAPATAEATSQDGEARPDQPPLQKIFADQDSFMHALDDEDLNPNVRAALRDLRDDWVRIRVAAEGTSIWDELVRPRISQLVDVLSYLQQKTRSASTELDGLRGDFHKLANALHREDRESVGRFLGSTYQLDNRLDALRAHVKHLDNLGFDTAARKFDWATIEADDRYRATKHSRQYGERHVEEMVHEFGELVAQGAGLNDIQTRLKRELGTKYKDWPRKQELLYELAYLARRTDRQAMDIPVGKALSNWQERAAHLRGGRGYSFYEEAGNVNYLAETLLGQTSQELAHLRRLERLTEAAAEVAASSQRTE